jgi:hypothetical protein
MTKPFKIVVFDLDETLGYFTEFGIFCDCLSKYFKNSQYSNMNFNELLDLYPEFLRPKIVNTLKYLKTKKKENKCYKVMIYTNNQGDKNWAINIKKYFDNKVEYELFDKIIAAFKVRGQHIELGRTSHDKTMDDFVRCTKLPDNIEVCFIDDLYHAGMVDDKVYYINVKPYKHQLSIESMTNTFLDSNLGSSINDKERFTNSIHHEFKKYSYRIHEKTVQEQQIDEIIGKRMLQHLKQFFYEKTNKTFKNKNKNKNKDSTDNGTRKRVHKKKT